MTSNRRENMRNPARMLLAIVMVGVIGGFAYAGVMAGSSGAIPVVVDLVAGQNMDAGDVVMWNDAGNLYVQFKTVAPWKMSETHVEVATSPDGIPQQGGNPVPGLFELKTCHSPAVTEWTYSVPMTAKAGTALCVAAHASLTQPTATTIVSAIGDVVYGPLYVETPIGDASWGAPMQAVQAKNWIGNADNPILPGVYIGSPLYWWGTDIVTATDVPGATWISTSENTEVWWMPSWRWFTKEFTVASGGPASISINVDDAYSLYLNGVLVGSDGYVFGPPLDPGTGVETYTVELVPGVNKLDVIAKNAAYTADGENLLGQLHNPNGLAYKVSVVAEITESAWSAGTPFSGASWATYSTYCWQKA